MGLKSLRMALSIAAVVALGACSRDTGSEQAERSTESASPAADVRERETQELERRFAEVERKWQETRNRAAREASETAAAMRAEIDSDLEALREALGDLRTTTAQNWWERQERALERTVERAEQDVRRVARNWTPPSDEVGTTGTATDWRSRRDALVQRLEMRMHSMEDALDRFDPRDPESAAVEMTRTRLSELREHTGRLRNASESEWWEITKSEIAGHLDRLEEAIDRLAEGRV